VNIAQCDNCRHLAPLKHSFPPDGWLIISVVARKDSSASSFAAMVTGMSNPARPAAMFCSWRCAAEYCAGRALLAEEDGWDRPLDSASAPGDNNNAA
jgi:hypothetical protein